MVATKGVCHSLRPNNYISGKKPTIAAKSYWMSDKNLDCLQIKAPPPMSMLLQETNAKSVCKSFDHGKQLNTDTGGGGL